ncbi:MAG TPA: NAD(P)H-hydrate dehydratase [Ramlibacter sp.]|nr:NAD(P)H-hydrate dehydratase [Ramlibacter sp.]
MHASATWTLLDAALLRRWPLPEIPSDADKEVRGRVLVVGGSREIPGAAVLAGVAALRAGAGKLVMATARSVATQLAMIVPEARVIALPENDAGSFVINGIALLDESLGTADAILVGPGLMDDEGTAAFTAALLAHVKDAPVILDARAMQVAGGGKRFDGKVLLTPHAGEMAGLLGEAKQDIENDPSGAALRGARAWGALVASKGATTWIADASGRGWRHDAGLPGLATSGSGDVLAGVIAGLAARGAPLEQAAAWGVVVHALAGAKLAQRHAALGYLARELPGEIPAIIASLQRA